MPDMLVKLYTLPELAPLTAQLKAAKIEIRRAGPWEKHLIASWVQSHFGGGWAAACEVALEQRPVGCFIAVEQDLAPAPTELLLAFACYDVASRGMFGPTGVQEAYRRRGIGTALLLACLHAMFAEGYAYAIIGQVGPAEFYAKTVGATLIDGSEPGVARRRLVPARPIRD